VERRTVLAEVTAEERAVAWAMAEDRFALTLTGLFALQNAGKSWTGGRAGRARALAVPPSGSRKSSWASFPSC
jgi:hypothetical protein